MVILKFLFSAFSAVALETSLGLGTQAPIGNALSISLSPADSPVYIKGQYGLTMPAYTDLLNSIATDMDFYNEPTGDIIAEALKDAQFWELSLGLRPSSMPLWGFELGYFSIQGSGQISGSLLFSAIANITLPAGGNIYGIKGEMWGLTARTSYNFALNDKSSLYLYIGVLAPQEINTNLNREVSGPVQAAILHAANRELDNFIKDAVEGNTYIPLLGAYYMYRFK